ncbi:MAG: HEAT repeat domain-containing protein [Candidatus Kapaibacterium sp.]
MHSSKKSILNFLNIESGEGLATGLLLIHSFVIGASLAFYFAPANALFIREFGVKSLPYAYIASGIIGYITGMIYTRVQRKYQLSKVFTGTLIFLITLVSALIVGFKMNAGKEITFLLFACLATIFSLSYLEFWGLALRMFNLRQGKRLFGLLSTGEIISSIIGYLSIPVIIPMLHDTTDLLFFAVGGMLCSLVLLRIIVAKFPENLTASRTVAGVRPQSFPFSTLLKNRYFVLIFAVAAVSMMAAYFTDYFYLSLTRIRFVTKEELTRFIGIFFAMVKVVELVMSLLSAKLLKQYGMKLGLTLLPTLVLGVMALAAVMGTIYGINGSLFFIFIAFNKLIERAVRKAIDGSSFRILYQPLASELQLDVQAKVEGIISHLAIIVTGLVLLGFSLIPGATLVHCTFVFLGIIILWRKSAHTLYEHYRIMLKSTLEERSSSVTGMKSIRSVAELLQDRIRQSTGAALVAAQNFLDHLFPHLGRHPAVDQGAGGGSVRKIQVDELTVLARSSNPADRERAVTILGESSRFQSFRLVQELLEDESPNVKKAAILASGRLKRSEFWHYLMESLPSEIYGDVAAAALTTIGLPVLQELDRHFSRTGQSRNALKKMIRIMKDIGGKQAIEVLRAKLHYPDKEIRYEVMNALAESQYAADRYEYTMLKQDFEEEVGSMVWTMAAIVDVAEAEGADDLVRALSWEYAQKKERLYVLLSLMFDAKTIGYIREIMENGSGSSRVYALEIIDITVPPEMKHLFLPFVEDLAPKDCIHAFKFLYPQEELSVNERLKNIIFKENSTVHRWTKACALLLLGNDTSMESAQVLLANTVHSDMLLAECAGLSLMKTQPTLYIEQVYSIKKLSDSGVRERISDSMANRCMLMYEKVRFLKNGAIFRNVPEHDIVDIARLTDEIELKPGEEIHLHHRGADYCFWVVSGSVTAISPASERYTEYSFIGTIGSSEQTPERYRITEPTRLLRINKYKLYEPIAAHTKLADSFLESVVSETITV